jgi:hypothetical protein
VFDCWSLFRNRVKRARGGTWLSSVEGLLASRVDDGLAGDRMLVMGALSINIIEQNDIDKKKKTDPYAYEVGIERGLGGRFGGYGLFKNVC